MTVEQRLASYCRPDTCEGLTPVSHSAPPVGGGPDTLLPVTVEEVEFQDVEYLPKVTVSPRTGFVGVGTPRESQSSCAIWS